MISVRFVQGRRNQVIFLVRKGNRQAKGCLLQKEFAGEREQKREREREGERREGERREEKTDKETERQSGE